MLAFCSATFSPKKKKKLKQILLKPLHGFITPSPQHLAFSPPFSPHSSPRRNPNPTLVPVQAAAAAPFSPQFAAICRPLATREPRVGNPPAIREQATDPRSASRPPTRDRPGVSGRRRRRFLLRLLST